MLPKLVTFIMEQAETQPLVRRIAIYRDLIGELEKKDQEQLLRLIEQLEAAHEQSHQLIFNFSTRS